MLFLKTLKSLKLIFTMFEQFIRFARELYSAEDFIPLHRPLFIGNEKKYLLETIDSTYVSSVGSFVDAFEKKIAEYVGARYAVATVNGTAALHTALLVAEVAQGEEVLTQPLTFAATCAAISYCGANPTFIDIDRNTLGMSPANLAEFLEKNCEVRDDGCRNRVTGRMIRACIPMHSFGHPAEIDEIVRICTAHRITVIEDAAESLGSYYQGKHTGTFGDLGVLSFNGNKIMTTGGGGMVLTDDPDLAQRAKHLTTTAKIAHQWEYDHDMVGYNYRMPNINAALGVAQLELLDSFISKKRYIAEQYQRWCATYGVDFQSEPQGSRSNYWLNALLLKTQSERDEFLKFTNDNGVMTRPAWKLMHQLPMYKGCARLSLTDAEVLAAQIVNVPSSVMTE